MSSTCIISLLTRIWVAIPWDTSPRCRFSIVGLESNGLMSNRPNTNIRNGCHTASKLTMVTERDSHPTYTHVLFMSSVDPIELGRFTGQVRLSAKEFLSHKLFNHKQRREGHKKWKEGACAYQVSSYPKARHLIGWCSNRFNPKSFSFSRLISWESCLF